MVLAWVFLILFAASVADYILQFFYYDFKHWVELEGLFGTRHFSYKLNEYSKSAVILLEPHLFSICRVAHFLQELTEIYSTEIYSQVSRTYYFMKDDGRSHYIL